MSTSTKRFDNLITGTAGDDRINGGQGDDVLIGGAGNDYIDGGPHGDDTAVYSGNFRDYSITFSAGPTYSEGYKITVVDNRAGSPDGTDTLRRIEILQFADGIYKDGQFISNGGSNTPATIGNPTAASVTEDVGVSGGNLVATGKISISDPDLAQAFFLTSVTAAPGNLGTLALKADGSYSYTVANSAVQYLGANATRVENFTITSADGTAKQVSFTIHGSNDAALIGTPSVSTVTEDVISSVDGKLTATGSISLSDADAGQASFLTTVSGASGNLGMLVMASNGTYLYSVANSATQYLGANDSKVDSFTISSVDGTTKTVSFTVRGANDDAEIGDPTNSSVTEDVGVAGGRLKASGSIAVSDADSGQASFQTTVTGAQGNLGTLALAANGAYTYSVANSAVQYLGANDSKIDSFTVRSADGTAKTVTFTINGANDAAVIGTPTVSALTEDGAVSGGNLTATGRISIADADAGQAVFQTAVSSAPGNLGALALATNGNYTYSVANSAVQYLGAGVTATDTFTISSADGTTKNVNFKITGANDAPVIAANYGVATNPNTSVSGSVTATDVDSGDSLVYTLDSTHKPAHGTVSVAANGNYTYTPSSGYTGADAFNIVVSDGHGGTVTATVLVNVTAGPLNHDPRLTGTPAALDQGVEDTAYTVTAASLLAGFTDVDGDTLSVASLSADRGTVTNNGNGTYTITPAANYSGPVTLSYTVIDGRGGHTAATQQLSLTAVNDPAVVNGMKIGTVTEAGGVANATPGTPTASGTLTDIDVDNLANTFQATALATPSSHGYGTFTMTAGGLWTYTLDNSNATVQSLNVNQTLDDGFTVYTADGTPQAITISIKGANDAPTITAPSAISYADTSATDVFAASTGTLAAADLDAGATLTFGIVGGTRTSTLDGYDIAKAGAYGTLYLNSTSGTYSFVPNSTAINALAANVNASDAFSVSVSDGLGGTASQTLNVNLSGANDASVISGVSGPLQYTVGQPAPAVVAPALSLGDLDSGLVTNAKVVISGGFHAGNDVLAFQLPNGSTITGSYDINTGVLSFSGSATLAEYQAVLESVTFNTPIIGGRTISFTVFDGPIASVTVDTSNVSLESLKTTGFKIPGETAFDHSGAAMYGAGDVNGDGFSDVIIGAPWSRAHGDYTGRSYVVFGKASAFDPEIPLWSLDGSNGFRMTGVAAGDYAGFSVNAAGDVNGDGFADVIVGALYATPNGYASGAAYVVFGNASFASNIELSSLDGTNGFRLAGEPGSIAGIAVSSAGDVNGDGFDDVMVGAYAGPNANNAGATYVVFGKASGFGANIELSALTGGNGFRILGLAPGDSAGVRVNAAGDVNGDGFGDLLIGATGADANGSDSGAAYVVFGKPGSFAADVDLAALNGGNGFRIVGATAGDFLGFGIHSAGDVNGDGFDDVIVSTPYADAHGVDSGEAYVLFGKASGFASDINLATLGGSDGFRILGAEAGDQAGQCVSSAGDFNGDGYGDLIVGAPGAKMDGLPAGQSYVLFGKAAGFASNVNLSTLAGQDGFRVSAVANGDDSGYSVSSAGDVNGDGFDDIAVSSSKAAPHGQSQAGETYVIFGAKLVVGGETFLGSTSANTLTGTPASETFIGGQGDDTMIGNGGKDAFSGGSGNDSLHLGASGQAEIAFVNINGGSGFDTLALDGSGVTLNLTAAGADRIHAIEQIDLTGSGNNALVLSIQDVLNISDSSNRLFVEGNVGDSVTSSGQGWALAPGGPVVDHGHTFNSYTLHGDPYSLGMANLLIEQQLTVLVS